MCYNYYIKNEGEKLMNWSVYKHTNKTNGKVYIGITGIAPEDRWRYGGGYFLQKYFYNAILKYGWDGFTHEVLYTNLTQKEAQEKERELIAKYKSNYRRYSNPNYGYNATDGGEGASGYGVPVNQYDLHGHFLKTWYSAKEAAESLDCPRSSIVYTCQGVQYSAGNYMWRYNFDEPKCVDIDSYYTITGFMDPLVLQKEKEIREKENKEWQKVIQYSLYGEIVQEWDNLARAAEYFNTSITHLWGVCIGKNKSACGYIWRFAHPERRPESYPTYTRIEQYKNGKLIETFLSYSDAERKTGFSGTNISKACRGERRNNRANGYEWKKVEVEIG
jgi:hypothetical protein